MLNRFITCIALASLLLLASCAGQESVTEVYSESNGATGSDGISAESAEQTSESADPPALSDAFLRQRILADILYDARLAYEDNRLMAPPGNNAYEGYRSVLDFDPENEVALQGIRDIALRYVQLADSAIRGRQFDNAEEYLDNATHLEVEASAITTARQRLEQARDIQMDIFELDGEALTDRGLDIMVELGEIGEYIQNTEATFLINARTDEEGRWIYKVMREAVGGRRLRGNIAVDSEPSIQVVVPKS